MGIRVALRVSRRSVQQQWRYACPDTATDNYEHYNYVYERIHIYVSKIPEEVCHAFLVYMCSNACLEESRIYKVSWGDLDLCKASAPTPGAGT